MCIIYMYTYIYIYIYKVCTALLGRGFDFNKVKFVINYDTPKDAVECPAAACPCSLDERRDASCRGP